MLLGFELTESLAGRLRLDGARVERPLALTIRARSGPILRFLRRPALTIEGSIDADGLASNRAITGSIAIESRHAQRRFAYAFTFVGDDGVTYEFVGERGAIDGTLFPAFTVLVGAIRDERGVVGEALLRFDVQRDGVALVKSFRATL